MRDDGTDIIDSSIETLHERCATLHGVFIPLTDPVPSGTALASAGAKHAKQLALSEAFMAQVDFAEADETWDSEAAILSQRRVSYDELSDAPCL